VDVRKYTKYPFSVADEKEQDEKESRRLWAGLTEGILANDQDKATDEKSAVEERERALRKEREDKNKPLETRFFNYDGEESTFKFLDQ
jgi:hypothetical protein